MLLDYFSAENVQQKFNIKIRNVIYFVYMYQYDVKSGYQCQTKRGSNGYLFA